MGTKIVFSDVVKKDLSLNFTLQDEIHTQCQNGHVFLLFTNNGESISRTLKQVNELFSLKTSKRRLYNAINIAKKWTTHYVRDCSKFMNFCNRPFAYHPSNVPMMQGMHLNQSNSLITVSGSSVLSAHEHIDTVPLVNGKPFSPVSCLENENR